MQFDHVPFLSAQAVDALLPMPALIDAVASAFLQTISAPPRLVLRNGGPDWLTMPCLTQDGELVCKLVRADVRETPRAGVPTITGVIVLLSADGEAQAIIDAAALTARRTAAVAAHATDVLASREASVLAIFGAGALALRHVEALDCVRPLSAIRVVGRSPDRSRAFVEELRAQGREATLETPESALAGADLVVTVTTAETPVFSDASIQPGMHINAMGSYTPDRREIPGETVARSLVVVESRETAWTEAGDLVQPLQDGLIDDQHVVADLAEGAALRGIRAASPSAISLFKSVGHAALDLAAVALLRPALTPA
jgi:ornithine cyclodeaminase/alanine dehydrogenase-like protein (mu-crystallin family)